MGARLASSSAVEPNSPSSRMAKACFKANNFHSVTTSTCRQGEASSGLTPAQANRTVGFYCLGGERMFNPALGRTICRGGGSLLNLYAFGANNLIWGPFGTLGGGCDNQRYLPWDPAPLKYATSFFAGMPASATIGGVLFALDPRSRRCEGPCTVSKLSTKGKDIRLAFPGGVDIVGQPIRHSQKGTKVSAKTTKISEEELNAYLLQWSGTLGVDRRRRVAEQVMAAVKSENKGKRGSCNEGCECSVPPSSKGTDPRQEGLTARIRCSRRSMPLSRCPHRPSETPHPDCLLWRASQ